MTSVTCLINGQLVSDWPALDRGLHYGDGLFETFRLDAGGEIPFWSWHQARLQEGVDRLFFPADTLDRILACLPEIATAARADGASGGKLLVTRGVGPRGYGIPVDTCVNLQWQLFQAPGWRWNRCSAGVQTGISPVRLALQPLLAGIKHLNRLEQVLARRTFADHWGEALLLDQSGSLVEGCMSNLFWIQNGCLFTPSLDGCGVNGVIRRWLSARVPSITVVANARPEVLMDAELVFMSNCLMGLVPVASIDEVFLTQGAAALAQLAAWQTELESWF